MMRRTFMIAVVALGLILGGTWNPSAYGRFLSSARTFRQHYRELKQTGDVLSPWQRVALSIVLTNEKAERPSPAPRHHS